MRQEVLQGAEGLGFALDREANAAASPTAATPVADVSASDSRVKVLVIRTFEEIVMARQCLAVLKDASP